LSSQSKTTLPDGVQNLDDSTTDAHVFPVPANPSGSSAALEKKLGEVHAGEPDWKL
jgi:hypothetical protein